MAESFDFRFFRNYNVEELLSLPAKARGASVG